MPLILLMILAVSCQVSLKNWANICTQYRHPLCKMLKDMTYMESYCLMEHCIMLKIVAGPPNERVQFATIKRMKVLIREGL